MFELKRAERIEIGFLDHNLQEFEMLDHEGRCSSWRLRSSMDMPILRFRSHQDIPGGRYHFKLDDFDFVDSRIDPIAYHPDDIRYDPSAVGNLYHVSDYRYIRTLP